MENYSSNSSLLAAQPPYSWFSNIWVQFVNSVSKQQFGHAVLLIGDAGIGTLDLARSMALYLLCVAPQAGRSCGACKACLLNQSDGHPDLMLISPEEKSTSIKIDQIRAVSDSVSKTAQQGGNKVIVLSPAESMNVNAANALLKNLEEPTGRTHFILVCERPSGLLATIKSRCVIWTLPLPSKDETLNWLKLNKVENPEQGLDLLGNNPLEIRRWVDEDLFAQRAKLESLIIAVLNGDDSVVKASQKIQSMGVSWVIEQLQSWLLSIAKSKVAGVDIAQMDFAKRLERVNARRLLAWESSLASRRAMINSGANPNLELLVNEILLELVDIASV